MQHLPYSLDILFCVIQLKNYLYGNICECGGPKKNTGIQLCMISKEVFGGILINGKLMLNTKELMLKECNF